MQELRQQITAMLNRLKQECLDKERQYKADNRADEARFEKIKGNITQIFLSVLGVAYQQTQNEGGHMDMLIAKYLAFFDKIPAT